MHINYIHEPTDLQCGQAVLAMVLEKTPEYICSLLDNDRETDLKEMKSVFRSHGVWISDERKQVRMTLQEQPLHQDKVEQVQRVHVMSLVRSWNRQL